MGSYIPRRQRRPFELTEDAWAEWGEDAVYFVIRLGIGADGGPGLDFYAINPTDELLPVYKITSFHFDVNNRWFASASAIVGSRAYVISKESMWFCDFAGGSSSVKWINGPGPSPPLIFNPLLVSMRGNLYALGYRLPSCECSFQLLCNGEFWKPLDPPPGPLPHELELWEAPRCNYFLIGVSCIGDRKLILHVSTPEQALKAVPQMVNISGENHFLVFEFKGDSIMHGEWTRLTIRPYDSWGCDPCPRATFPDRSYFPEYQTVLGAGLPLLLPLMPGKLFAFGGFGDSDSSAIRLEFPQEVHIEWPTYKSYFGLESQLNTSCDWNLIHLGGSKYCVIAFPPRPRFPDGLLVFTFDLLIHPPPGKDDDTGMGCSDASAPTGSKFTAVNVRSNHRCRLIGIPKAFVSGKAFTSSCS